MNIKPDPLQRIIKAIQETRSDEIDCGECFDELDQFAETVLAGKSAEEAMSLVQDHLNRCPNCHEEYEALLAALKSMT